MNVGAAGSAPGQGGFMADGAYDQNNAGGFGAGGAYGSGMGSQMAAMNNQTGFSAIETRVEWRFLFFGGACSVLFAGVISIFHFIISFGDVAHWSPCTFLSCCFLLVFGLMMMVLDWPMKTGNPQILTVRDNIYTFALFLTRFTGRGLWYVFLGSHCWVALYDDSINQLFGIVLTTYLVILGLAAAAKGIILSKKLHDVHKDIREKRFEPQNLVERGANGLNRAGFKMMVQQVSPTQQFTEAEYDYIINALCFKPRFEQLVSLEELQYWLQQGPMLLV